MNGGVAKASFWIDLAERTLRAFLQGMVGALAIGGVGHSLGPINDLPWLTAVEIGGSTAAVCVLTGLSSLRFGDRGTASFLPPPGQTSVMMKRAFGIGSSGK